MLLLDYFLALCGSINKLWPWKIVTAYRTSSEWRREAISDENLFPGRIRADGFEPKLMVAVAAFCLELF
jgi:putative membrane protein